MRSFSRLTIAAVVVLLMGGVGMSQGKSAAKSVGEKPAAKSAAKYWNADQGKWADFPGIPGLHDMAVSGDPSKGASVLYLKIDPQATIPLHWHSGPEILYGDSGTFEVAMFKSDQKAKVTSGSYAKLPAHMIHKAQCISKEPCMLYLESPQIFDFHIVDESGKEIPAETNNQAKKKKS